MADILDTVGQVAGTASPILGAAEGAIQLFSSIGKERKDKSALNSLTPSFYKIQDEYLQNKNISEGQAQGGLPQATKDYLTGESQRGLGATISGVLQSGGSPNDINRSFDTYNKSIDRTAAEDAEMHQKNIDYFVNVNKDLAGQRSTQWALNKYQSYQEKKKQLSEKIAADKTNAYGGANTAIGSFGALGTSLENNSLLKQLFKTNSTSNPSAGASLSNSTFNDTRVIPSIPTPGMANSTSYIDPFTPNPTLNYINPFE